jgi:hypothetical protein
MFPIKNGLKKIRDALSSFLFNFALRCAIRWVQLNQESLKLGASVNTEKKNTEDLIVSIKAIGLEVNSDIPKYMIMFRDQNVGGSHSTKK